MGFQNPPVPWSQVEAALSGRARPFPSEGDGGDAPGWSYHRPDYIVPADLTPTTTPRQAGVRYAELHCHSNFSFLDGASHPEELVEEAARLGLEAIALTDHDGMYGVVRFAEAAAAVGMRTVFGAELSLGLTRPQNGVADPEGAHLVVLARDAVGYARLCRALSTAQMAGQEKGKPQITLDELTAIGHGAAPPISAAGTLPLGEQAKGGTSPVRPTRPNDRRCHWLVLTGCRKGTVPAALLADGPSAAARRLDELVDRFGAGNVAVELWDHGDPLDSARNDALADLALRRAPHGGGDVELIATTNAHYATPARRPLATALAAVRARRSLDEIDGWLPAGAGAHLRSGEEQARRFARYPGVVERAADLARSCAFDLRLVAPNLPDFPVPPRHTEMSWLREVTARGANRLYGPRSAETVPGAYAQIEHELALIDQLNFPGYFLIVWDIVQFCERNGIYCQGRGSAANSAVCYALGITKADAVKLGLLFERFLSPERDGPPDIDIDIESERREEAIQYVYERYGRENAAQVANVITYRPRSAVRDMAKALGHSTGQQDAWSKQVDGWGPLSVTADLAGKGDVDIPENVLRLAAEVQHFPRHLGIHSGGMVICDRPVVEVCPVEWGRMEDRSVLQWDKDDCARAGLVKFDLLGLGMLTMLHHAVDLVRGWDGTDVDLALLPQENAVYEMLQRADSVGVFQVESRAQMATLPRLKPRTFYDLVVEVALIRPGPIQGGSVHPYIRRRNGEEEVTYLHPLLQKSLSKTLGVPLFQEQLMQMAIDVAGFSAAEADQLRQAMGSKRSTERMEALKARLYAGMAERGIEGEVADQIYAKLAAFANFGFPESHSVSFAYLVYSSSWFKLHHPAAFCAALLNAQPMGFWSPQTIVADARRHGVTVLGPDVNLSGAKATLVDAGADAGAGPAVRMGVEYVRTIGKDLAEKIAAGRPWPSMEALTRACELTQAQVEALATAGAFGSFGVDRREALWAAGAVSQSRPGRLPGLVVGERSPALPGMSEPEEVSADLWATGVAPAGSPVQFVRPDLDAMGVIPAAGLVEVRHGKVVWAAGVVTHRQRPATAGGVTFMNLEDETGLINVILSTAVWNRHRRLARSAAALLIRGRVERVETVLNLVALDLRPLSLSTAAHPKSRDFR